MTDIVDRLLQRAAANTWLLGVPPEDLKEAADEIQSLRSHLQVVQQQAAAYRFIRDGDTWPRCSTAEEFDAAIFAEMRNSHGQNS